MTSSSNPKRWFIRGPKSIALIVAIGLALIVAGLAGAESYAHHYAARVVATAVQCEVEDSANASFSSRPPVLWQYISGRYPSVSARTAGNQVRSAKGMQVTIDIQNIRVNKTSDSKGTIGALNGNITWSTDGIKQSIQDALPMIGDLVTSSIETNPTDGTLKLKGLLDSAIVKPQIVDNGLSLQVIDLKTLGSSMSTQAVQQHLDDLTSKATKNYPLGIHADSVKVTEDGVQATFSTSNATIPTSSQSQSGQDCFSKL